MHLHVEDSIDIMYLHVCNATELCLRNYQQKSSIKIRIRKKKFMCLFFSKKKVTSHFLSTVEVTTLV